MGNHPGSEVRSPSIGRSLSTSDITSLNILNYRRDNKNKHNQSSSITTRINGSYKRKVVQGTPKYTKNTVYILGTFC